MPDVQRQFLKSQGICEHLSPGLRPFGLNGAALAAFGDIPALFKPALTPLLASVDGVKLGESTVRRFFRLLH